MLDLRNTINEEYKEPKYKEERRWTHSPIAVRAQELYESSAHEARWIWSIYIYIGGVYPFAGTTGPVIE